MIQDLTQYEKLYKGIGNAAWGYFFVYFDFKLGAVSILPSFVGYLLFLSAINYLSDEERELSLLKTLGKILVAWHIASWLVSLVSGDLSDISRIVNIIIGVINVYFHFQFLTNLASIAARHQPDGYEYDKKLLRYRTLQTVILTVVIITGYFAKQLDGFIVAISVSMMIVYLIAGILLMMALFGLRRCLPMDTETSATE